MKYDNAGNPQSRRRFLKWGAGTVALGGGILALPGTAAAAGATDDFQPYPIPWLDQNLHHNQVPEPGGPPTELSHIYHFQGQVGRALLTGEGTTGDGRTLYIGKGTDYGYMDGTFLSASGTEKLGTFSHL